MEPQPSAKIKSVPLHQSKQFLNSKQQLQINKRAKRCNLLLNSLANSIKQYQLIGCFKKNRIPHWNIFLFINNNRITPRTILQNIKILQYIKPISSPKKSNQ